MANHGVVTYGSTLENAYMKMETVEHFAHIALVAHVLGRAQPLGEKKLKSCGQFATATMPSVGRTPLSGAVDVGYSPHFEPRKLFELSS